MGGGGGDPPPSLQDGPADEEMDDDVTEVSHQSGSEGDQAIAGDEREVGSGEVEEREAPRQTRSIQSDSAHRWAVLVRGGVGRSGSRARSDWRRRVAAGGGTIQELGWSAVCGG